MIFEEVWFLKMLLPKVLEKSFNFIDLDEDIWTAVLELKSRFGAERTPLSY